MAQTPSLDDLAAVVASVKKEIAEAARKTLSTIAVTAANGVRMLNIAADAANSNRPQVTIRDSNNNILLQNDTVAGWGITHPIIGYPFYPYDGRQLMATSSGSYTGLAFTGVNLLSKKVQYSLYVSWDAGVTSVNVKLTYKPSGAGTDTIIVEQTLTGASGQAIDGSFLMPTDVSGSSTGFFIFAKVNAGAGNVGVTPNYFQTRGVNV